MATTTRVVIVGGGFGGLYAARRLKHADVQVTLIDRRNFHLFQPLLYQVATGGLSPADIASPLRGILKRQPNAHVLLGDVVDFDIEERSVLLGDGARIPYDYLVVATGLQNHYFGNEEWAEKAPGLKSLEDATEIRRRILLAFERAEREQDPAARCALLTFAVIGGGPTGVELAGTVAELARDTLRHDFRSIDPRGSKVLLFEGSSRILEMFPPDLSEKAAAGLSRLGVEVHLDSRVTDVREGAVLVKGPGGEQAFRAATVLWAAGVRVTKVAKILAEKTGASTDRGGRIIVGQDLSIPAHPEVFVLGDIAHIVDPRTGKPLPGVAPVAMQEGKHVARVIESRIRGEPEPPFRYSDKGSLATIGRASAVALIRGLRISGYLAWVVWLFVHILYLVGFENRILVLVQWAWNYFTWNRSARLITGTRAAPRGRTLPPPYLTDASAEPAGASGEAAGGAGGAAPGSSTAGTGVPVSAPAAG
jgi:NADH dehydrogenase